MEQQERALQKQTTRQETSHNEPQQQEHRSVSGFAAQALLNGSAVWDLPRRPLEELAERIGNSNMLELASMHTPSADLRQTALMDADVQVTVTEVPDLPCQLKPVTGLTIGTWPASAFDPAAMA